MKTALTIAGSDSCGGAGIQADIKTMMANGVYAMSAITALTAQNTTGVTSILNADSKFLGEELDAVFTDIYPDAVKIGMVSESDLIRIIASKLRQYNAKNIVVDPVMVATEAEVLTGRTISNAEEMIDAAKMISETYNCAVLCKGGHTINDANDLLYANNTYRWFYGKRIQNPNTHGTGCTLSSAIASNLAKGYKIDEAIRNAKDYISGALADGMDLGHGSGPMNHGFDLKSRFAES